MKRCSKCLEEKGLSQFHKDKSRTSGYRDRCKKCISEFMNLPHTQEIRRNAQRKYSKSDKGRMVEKRHSIKRRIRASKLKHHWAMGQVKQAKDNGLLEKKPCEVCGSSELIHAHHEDYSKPLDIKWLCPLHHSQRHKEIKNARNMVNSF